MHTCTPSRRPPGSPAGGQFSPTGRAESTLKLAAETTLTVDQALELNGSHRRLIEAMRSSRIGGRVVDAHEHGIDVRLATPSADLLEVIGEYPDCVTLEISPGHGSAFAPAAAEETAADRASVARLLYDSAVLGALRDRCTGRDLPNAKLVGEHGSRLLYLDADDSTRPVVVVEPGRGSGRVSFAQLARHDLTHDNDYLWAIAAAHIAENELGLGRTGDPDAAIASLIDEIEHDARVRAAAAGFADCDPEDGAEWSGPGPQPQGPTQQPMRAGPA